MELNPIYSSVFSMIMKNKFIKILILLLFVGGFIGSAVWMFKTYVKPNSPYNTEIKLRGQK
jgi:hypothetical protein